MIRNLGTATGRLIMVAIDVAARIAVLVLLVVGIPWVLVRFTGAAPASASWGWARGAMERLSQPMDDATLIRLLAGVAWICWLGLMVNLLRELLWYVRRMPELAGHGGARAAHAEHLDGLSAVRTVAAVIIGGMVLALLRSSSAYAMPVEARPSTAATVLTSEVSAQKHEVAAGESAGALDELPGTRAATTTPYVVQPGDTLWEIAKESLGDPWRWPEVYKASKDVRQPGGGRLTDPDLIYPGWTLLLPVPPPAPTEIPPPVVESPVPPPVAPSAPPVLGDPVPPPPQSGVPLPPAEPPPSAATPAPETPLPASTPPNLAPSSPDPEDDDDGFQLSSEAFVGLGLIAAVAVVVATVRIRRRRHYQPGSGRRDDLTMDPIVRAMLSAHEGVSPEPEPDGEPDAKVEATADPHMAIRRRALAHLSAATPPEGPAVGVQNGRTRALTLAGDGGVSLVGPGAADAARALLVNALASSAGVRRNIVRVVTTQQDLQRLLTGDAPDPLPTRLFVGASLRAALSAAEQWPLDPAPLRAESASPGRIEAQKTYLVVTPEGRNNPQLSDLISSGSRHGVTVVLLGRWPGVPTLTIARDGTVQDASPAIAQEARGLRLFHLPAADTSDLLRLLQEAGPVASGEPGLPPFPSLDPSPSAIPRSAPHTTRSENQGSAEALAGDDGRLPRRPQPPDRPRPRSPDPPGAPLGLEVLGRRRLVLRDGEENGEITGALAPKQFEVLTYLAVHRDGVPRSALAADLWPAAPADRPYNSLHATLSQLRQALRNSGARNAEDLVVHENGRYAIDAGSMTVDLWQVQADVSAARAATDAYERTALVAKLVDAYRGNLAPEITGEWIEAPREQLRRDVLDTFSKQALHLRQAAAPDQALALLERARDLDPYNEALYSVIMRVQRQLGLLDHIPRTLALLATALTEIEERPTSDTVRLCEELQRPNADDESTGRAAAS